MFVKRACLAVFLSVATFGTSAEAADCKPLLREASLPISRLPTGHITVPVTLMDRPTTLLFDTGGAIRSLSQRVVGELGLKAYAGRIQLRDLYGHTSDSHVVVPSMTLAGTKIQNVTFLIEPGDLDERSKRGFDGIFAPDLLNRVDFDLDFGAMTLNIFSQDHCPGKVVYLPASNVAVVPFDLHDGRITLPVTLDGKTVTALLDTGAVTTVMNVGVARSRFNLDLDGPDVQKHKFNDNRLAYSHKFKTLTLDGITMSNPLVDLIPNLWGPAQAVTGSHAIMDANTGMPDMLLGMALLSKLHVYIAYKEHKLYMTAASPPVARPESPGVK